MPLPVLTRLLGRRRFRLLLSQIVITIALVGMAFTDPLLNLTQLVFFALAVAFLHQQRKISRWMLTALEAVAIELQGAMAATYQAGYRIAMILASAGVLWIAAAIDLSEATYEHLPWQIAYLVMACSMMVGIITTLIIREPNVPYNHHISQNEKIALLAVANGIFLHASIDRLRGSIVR
jgi:PAT family beta-lactamase induction signal transducer AmpG